MEKLKKTAIVTGASSGIGIAFAQIFADRGYDLVLTSRSMAKLEATAQQLSERFSIEATAIAADLETEAGPSALYDEVKRRGLSADVLVNNAGYADFGEFRNIELDKALAMMRLNMAAPVQLTKLFMPDLLGNKGKILNVASTAAFQPGPYMAVYYATKSFALSFSEAIASELEGHGVTVTALCPGPTASGFQDKANMQHSALVKGKRLAKADQVAMAGYRGMIRGSRVVIPGVANWMMAQSVRFTPRNTVTALVRRMSRPS